MRSMGEVTHCRPQLKREEGNRKKKRKSKSTESMGARERGSDALGEWGGLGAGGGSSASMYAGTEGREIDGRLAELIQGSQRPGQMHKRINCWNQEGRENGG